MHASSHTRPVWDLNHHWEFAKGRRRRSWLGRPPQTGAPDVLVDLPHSWNETDTFQADVRYDRGWGAYRKELTLPDVEGAGEWRLEAGGFYGTGEVWLNGRRLADVDGQFLGFSIPLPNDTPPHSRLAIRLTNRCGRGVLPGISDPDFILHGGLAGGLWLRRLPAFRLSERSLHVTYSDPLSPTVHLRVAFRAECTGVACATGALQCRLLDPNGREVANSTSVPVRSGEDNAVPLRVEQPTCWDLNAPVCYTLETTLTDENGTDCDTLSVRIGFRSAEFRPRQGFFLNGQHVILHGCNRHENMPGFGSALPDTLQRADAAQLKDLGCNLVRLSHYPQHPVFLDACDQLGILVYAELASWKSVRTGRWLRAAERQWDAMIRRDRNRPCMLLWGMGNESRSLPAFQQLKSQAKKLDPERPVTYAENHLYRARRHKTLGISDVWALNYETDEIEAACAASRLQNVLVSELANYPPAQRGNGTEETAQVALIRSAWRTLEGQASVAGDLLWCFADYATDRKRRYFRHCGIVDAWRTPKRAAALLQAQFLHTPFMRAFADLRKQAPPGPRPVQVFTNAAEVQVFRSGTLYATFPGGTPTVWEWPFDGQAVELRARHQNGEATTWLQPCGPMARLVIEPDTETVEAASRPTVGFTLRLLDQDGHPVIPYQADIAVTVCGPARLRAFSPAQVVRVADGIGRGFITGRSLAGTVKLTAQTAACHGHAEIRFT